MVGLAGLALGGGLGLLGCQYGLTGDWLTGTEVALADGRVGQCTERELPESPGVRVL